MTDPRTSNVAPTRAASRYRRWWPAVVAIVAMVIAALVMVPRMPGENARGAWQPPAQTSLAEPMDAQPVVGWRAHVTDLGLPAADPGAVQLSRIGATNPPYPRDPFLGTLGDSAYFLATSPGEPTARWWLVGVDVRDGHRLFPAVPLNVQSALPPHCFRNGPTALLCVHTGNDAGRTVWVIDSRSGAVIFTGPTELNTGAGHNWVQQVGDYAVAETMNKGISGIGPHGELTWFVPGDGTVGGRQPRNSDLPTQTLTSQRSAQRGSDQSVVFSVVDGTIATPELNPDIVQQSTIVHSSGFVAELHGRDDSARRAIGFFDTAGKQRGQRNDATVTALGWQDVPVLRRADAPHYWVSNAEGESLAAVRLDGALAAVRLVGSRLFLGADPTRWDAWVQYDLATGEQAATCKVAMADDYLGSHGSTAVFTFGDPDTGIGMVARDLDTCETRWRMEPEAGSSRRVWRAGLTLIQFSADATELSSLVAPH
ncbi:hypothetical protein KIH27_04180 [Mycobacterium sp. M1]|uniref:Uncharacterized protein n=1 Tax=Mycolicibacter acidiphilus TaxID=2835306 RepID=A0ABS5RF08_9MYCO|nr:hypothetical protein [Mycolicibacter acidiphilus]MBS9532784.1 hypothetical protein [Mycolicibacter acidiphilus]